MTRRSRARAEAVQPAEILIYDQIGFFGVRAADIIAQLRGITADTIHVRINSPGGDVLDSVAIFNALRNCGAKLIVHIEALAASSASFIAMVGDEIRIAENAFLMVHNPFAMTVGDAQDHRDRADVLDRMAAMLAKTYQDQTEASQEKVLGWMKDETWFTAAEAKAAGFVTDVDGGSSAEAAFDLSHFTHVPKQLAGVTGRMAAQLMQLRPAAMARQASPIADEDTVTPEELKVLNDRLSALETENKTLKGQVDASTAKEAEAARRASITAKLAASKLPETMVTEHFRSQLMGAKDDATVDALIADRVALAKSIPQGTAAASVEATQRTGDFAPVAEADIDKYAALAGIH